MVEVKFIPMSALVEAGKENPEGTVKVKCNYCGREFAVSGEDAAASLFNNMNVCEECRPTYEAQQAQTNIDDMRSDLSETTAEELAAALGE